MTNYSPLRYPGGKNKFFELLQNIINSQGMNDCIFAEVYAGGASLSLGALFTGTAHTILLNDYDIAIYSVWKAILEESEYLIDRILSVDVNVDMWREQKAIYDSERSYSRELAFATLFLNRTNHSGILSAGPIGGFEQTGKYKIDARFYKNTIADRIRKIAEHKDNIIISNKDALAFLDDIKQYDNMFAYLDPPYYKQGKRLYRQYYDDAAHIALHDKLKSIDTYPWYLTYDKNTAIRDVYSDSSIYEFDLKYSITDFHPASEYLITNMDLGSDIPVRRT